MTYHDDLPFAMKDNTDSEAVVMLVDATLSQENWAIEKFLQPLCSIRYNNRHYFAYKMKNPAPNPEETVAIMMAIELDKTLVNAFIKALIKRS